MKVLATTGMGRWPFDRLVRALEPVARDHDLVAQIGNGHLRPSYPFVRHMRPSELRRHIAEADVVVTHAGNTVRLVQRMGKVPIVVAREAARGEMGNDHQVRFVETESKLSPMVVLSGDLHGLPEAVERHPEISVDVAARPVPPVATDTQVVEALEAVLDDRAGINPLWDDPTRRLSWAYSQLAHLSGAHLDLGCGHGELIDALVRHAGRDAVGVDAESGKLERATGVVGTGDGWVPDTVRGRVVHLGSRSPLPFADATFASVSMLDVLEHVWSEEAVLAEARRVLEPGGTIVVTVPRRHAFTFLDPGNARFRFPTLHRRLYSLRHGADRYEQRFVAVGDGMRGDTAVERTEHHNYRNDELVDTLDRAGFDVVGVDAANLFWRFADIPRSVLPDRFQHITHPMLRADARAFHSANLFVTARRR
ncbi:MAG: methyltransferase domain-containing protein [Acidimicrobiales bacterium]|nr:methyltransferase domain-containing protein [Acidimicrobiales bacterium]